MDSQHKSPDKVGSNKVLWIGMVVVLVVVLVMGVTLIRIQAQAEASRIVTMPDVAKPPANAAQAVASGSTAAASAADPLPHAAAATDLVMETNKPRIVQLRASEPAVARAPQRDTPTPATAEAQTPPDIRR
jgi:flagellar basal body-associated protein FliL